MKKLVILLVLLFGISFMASAQGFYFDVGLGFGKAWTKNDGNDVAKYFKDIGVDFSEIGVDFGLKAGYGPIAGIPIYIVGEIAGIGHRLTDKDNKYIQYNSFLFGPGVLFYPIPLLQLGSSFGYSTIANTTDVPGWSMVDGKGGFAWNVSAAVDLGQKNHGLLLGLKYFYAKNTVKVYNTDEKASMFGIFVKYAYRHKKH